MSKIFFIGFNKTGTTTYCNITRQHFRCKHDYIWTIKSRLLSDKDILHYFRRFKCWCDGECCDFKRLDRLFPNSKFILNDRDIKKWLYSRVRWVHRDIYSKHRAGPMHREYFNAENKKDVIRSWIETREKYYHDVYDYFKEESSKFMVIDIEKDNIIKKLSDFLNVKFIADNKKHNKSPVKQNYLQKELNDVDCVLKEMGYFEKDNKKFLK